MRAVLLAGSALALSNPANAADAGAAGTAETVYVWGYREEIVGTALSASEGIVDYAAFSDRPLLRIGELLEVVPGLAATQHSGTGKANQYFVRGFNIDHGTDFSTSLDGIPLNLPTHGHGQGYLDLNPLIPDLVQSIHFRKGPYFADVGDFSSTGTAAMELFEDLPQSFTQVTGGEHRYWRFLGAARLGEGSYLAGDYTVSDGPWTRAEDLKKISIISRVALGDWSLTGIAYDAEWNSADQIPLRAIEAGTLSRFGVVDPSDGGMSSRTMVYLRNRDLRGWNVLAYAQKYDLNLWSNFTYFLEDPVNGDQFQQSDDRWIYGASVSRAWTPAASVWGFAAGLSGRYDDIRNVALHHTAGRQILSTVRSDSVGEWAGSFWSEAERDFGALRATLGMRLDTIGADVESDNPLNSGTADDAMLSPKLALAWQASPAVEFYADIGRGFHSNDVRGATISVDPNDGSPASRVPLLVSSTGAELGARYQGANFSATAALWWLKLDSELVFVGDAGSTEASDGTERQGVEFLFNWQPIPRIDIDLSAAATHARFRGNPPGGNRIPNALEYIVTGGVSALVMDNLTATVTVRHLGKAPLVEDNSVRSETATVSNLQLRYQMGRFALVGEVLNLFDTDADDIQYFYGSRLPGEPAGGIEDFHIHPAEPMTFRVGLRADW
jgi:hypothetical protein